MHEKGYFIKVIHIIHTKTCVFGGILGQFKRTLVLEKTNENGIYMKKEEKNIDIIIVKKIKKRELLHENYLKIPIKGH